MKNFVGVLLFAAGAAAGVFGTRTYFKNKYEQQAKEDIESVKEAFINNGGFINKQSDDEEPAESEDDVGKLTFKRSNTSNIPVADYAGVISKLEYVRDEDAPKAYYIPKTPEEVEEEIAAAKEKDRPYVISPDDFGSFMDYEAIGLTYYADNVLTDENDEPIEELNDTVGEASLTHFGEYENDRVFVRNDRLKTDFEIIKSQERYADVLKEKPYIRGV